MLDFRQTNETEDILGEAIKRILIVDDEENTRIGLSKLLAQDGFEVESAANGNEALDCLGQRKVSLVISDINMPDMNGLAFLRELSRKYQHQCHNDNSLWWRRVIP